MSVTYATGPLVFLTDFGMQDGYVGVMKGVVAGIAPAVQCIDLTHDVPAQKIAAAAWVLFTSYRFFPPGSIFVCVVDPGVGSQRRPLVVQLGDWFFVGPDNGLFSYVLSEEPFQQAVTPTNSAYQRATLSATFHGRDLFSPVAAHLARGVLLSELGPALKVAELQRLTPPLLQQEGERIVGQVVHQDHFGNLITSIPYHLVPDLFDSAKATLTFTAHSDVVITERQRFFAEAPDRIPFLFMDSAGYIAVAIRNGNASETLRVSVGTTCILTL